MVLNLAMIGMARAILASGAGRYGASATSLY
jgi:hypothetical protein